MTKQNLMNRRLKALELKTMGYTVRDIAKQLDVSPTTAHNDIDALPRDMAEKEMSEKESDDAQWLFKKQFPSRGQPPTYPN